MGDARGGKGRYMVGSRPMFPEPGGLRGQIVSIIAPYKEYFFRDSNSNSKRGVGSRTATPSGHDGRLSLSHPLLVSRMLKSSTQHRIR